MKSKSRFNGTNIYNDDCIDELKTQSLIFNNKDLKKLYDLVSKRKHIKNDAVIFLGTGGDFDFKDGLTFEQITTFFGEKYM